MYIYLIKLTKFIIDLIDCLRWRTQDDWKTSVNSAANSAETKMDTFAIWTQSPTKKKFKNTSPTLNKLSWNTATTCNASLSKSSKPSTPVKPNTWKLSTTSTKHKPNGLSSFPTPGGKGSKNLANTSHLVKSKTSKSLEYLQTVMWLTLSTRPWSSYKKIRKNNCNCSSKRKSNSLKSPSRTEFSDKKPSSKDKQKNSCNKWKRSNKKNIKS